MKAQRGIRGIQFYCVLTSALGRGVNAPPQPLSPGRAAVPTGIGWMGLSAGLDGF